MDIAGLWLQGRKFLEPLFSPSKAGTGLACLCPEHTEGQLYILEASESGCGVSECMDGWMDEMTTVRRMKSPPCLSPVALLEDRTGGGTDQEMTRHRVLVRVAHTPLAWINEFG